MIASIKKIVSVAVLALLSMMSVMAYERNLSIGERIGRRLYEGTMEAGSAGSYDWNDLYARCCNTGQGPTSTSFTWKAPDANSIYSRDGAGMCRCPVRGLDKKPWYWRWWGDGKTYYETWEESCSSGGTICDKASDCN